MTRRKKPLRHERRGAERFGMFAHYGWAVFCASQGLMSVAYCWFWWGVLGFFNSPAAQALFWISVSSAVFGLGGTVWHLAAGNEHRRATRRAKRGVRGR